MWWVFTLRSFRQLEGLKSNGKTSSVNSWCGYVKEIIDNGRWSRPVGCRDVRWYVDREYQVSIEPSLTRSISSVLFHNSCDEVKFPTFFFRENYATFVELFMWSMLIAMYWQINVISWLGKDESLIRKLNHVSYKLLLRFENIVYVYTSKHIRQRL